MHLLNLSSHTALSFGFFVPKNLKTYMYVCMYVCMYACMHACMYIFVLLMYVLRFNLRPVPWV